MVRPAIRAICLRAPRTSLTDFAGWCLRVHKHRNAGKRAAFEPFQECAACSGHISELIRYASGVERRHGVAAACDGDERAGLGEPGGFACKLERRLAEWRYFESPDGTVPEEGFATR